MDVNDRLTRLEDALIDLAVVVSGGHLDHLASANMSPVVREAGRQAASSVPPGGNRRTGVLRVPPPEHWGMVAKGLHTTSAPDGLGRGHPTWQAYGAITHEEIFHLCNGRAALALSLRAGVRVASGRPSTRERGVGQRLRLGGACRERRAGTRPSCGPGRAG
jgi:hypothetical protein